MAIRPSDRDELTIYNHLKAIGLDNPFQTYLGELANTLGMDDRRLERTILSLHRASVLDLSFLTRNPHGGLNRFYYPADQNPGGLGNGLFEIKLSWSGLKYFEDLEIKAGGPNDARIFISCGQSSEEEIQLGLSVARVIRTTTGRDAYFAQNQTSFEAVSTNILKALNAAGGFVAIMHDRGRVFGPDGQERGVRASVWIEQEIAIAAFLAQAQGREIELLVYRHRDIMLEGLRSGIILNPVPFVSTDEVIADLEAKLRDGLFAVRRAGAR